VAGEERDRLGTDVDLLGSGDPTTTPATCSALGRLKSKRWHRSTTVGRTLLASVVASTKIVFGGGPRASEDAFQAAAESMCASSRM